jgi:hypothetical protein
MASLTDDPRAFPEREYRATAVPESVPARITRLSKEVAEAGHALDGSRRALDNANHINAEYDARFRHLSEELLQAIQEHREGTPSEEVAP